MEGLGCLRLIYGWKSSHGRRTFARLFARLAEALKGASKGERSLQSIDPSMQSFIVTHDMGQAGLINIFGRSEVFKRADPKGRT